ncbi:tellurite resistance/C4-dicarboxylate transporter family protein [Leucobacter denitrificans]|uniref:Tellurite resistance/C4-dicarboxylate transporter family protein n=1 Tax=Leucobacter denitrificans TaxID=683042 RepID=A0A7G9S5D6_9MICO|nr:tellurite resistance/C4-dicarboxylate transporter family protein [Leucobacter denitrificans]QNN63061.1 tellurite resistance/C4-dicarboxylate transporter family protein [Leucobacter denitrificans]
MDTQSPTGQTSMGARSEFSQAIENLAPGYFALVMGTGIISVGLSMVGFQAASAVLLGIAACCYVVLWVLYVWRAIHFREAMLHDLRDPEKAFAYFTIVAGSGVLAVALIRHGIIGPAVVLIAFAALLWFVFGYLLPWQVFMTRDGKPILARTNGTWFIWAVASQSVVVCMAQIEPHVTAGRHWVGILAVLSWSVGVALYAGVAILVLLRIIHYGITAAEFEPPYWVAMGALAIAVVAGTNIIDMQSTPMVDATRTIIAGTVVIFWSFCVWLIPMLVGAGFWRHIGHRVPLKYMPTLWSMVFPIGMFAVASVNIGRVDRLPVAEAIGHVMMVVAVLVWLTVFIGMLIRITRVLARSLGIRA